MKDILVSKEILPDNFIKICIEGNAQKIKDYYRICRQISKGIKQIKNFAKENETNSYFNKDKGKFYTNSKKILNTEILEIDTKPKVEITNELLEKIKQLLPEQPWSIGIHKIIAEELNIANSCVSKSINILIKGGFFKKQSNGQMIE